MTYNRLLNTNLVHQRPPAVCIIDENLPVPRDTRVWREARALTEAGYQVSVICPKGRGCEQARETLDGVEIYRHSVFEAPGRLGYLAEYLWALTVEFLLALRIYATTRFCVLHACNPPDTIFLIACFFKLFGVRFVSSISTTPRQSCTRPSSNERVFYIGWPCWRSV